MPKYPNVYEHRRDNVCVLVTKIGGDDKQSLSLKLGRKNGSYLGRIVNNSERMGERAARKMEADLNHIGYAVPEGALDLPPEEFEPLLLEPTRKKPPKPRAPPFVERVEVPTIEVPRRRSTDLRLGETPSDVGQKIIAMVYDSAREIGSFPEGAKLAIIVDLAIEHAHTAGIDRAYIDRLVRLIGDNHNHN